jgi:hypothetical protein
MERKIIMFLGNLGTLELLMMLVLVIIAAAVVAAVIVVILLIVNAGKKREQHREEALGTMYSQRNFRIEAIRNLKERGKPFDEYDVELEIERIKHPNAG